MFAKMKLGKKAPKHDKRTLRMASYLTDKLPILPASKSWTGRCSPSFGMLGNDQLGDCTIAAIGHMIQVWTANAGAKRELTLPDSAIISAYSSFCGYNPADPNTDQGGVELEVLNDWRQDGVGGHKIDAYVALEPHNDHHLQASIALFGGAYIGLSLPLTAQDQQVWSVVANSPDAEPGSWGGHAVCIVGYDQQFYSLITWGRVVKATKAFMHAYCDEAYACLSPDWASSASKAPNGFDRAALQADLAQL